MEEGRNTPNNALEEGRNTPNNALEEGRNIPNNALEEGRNTPNNTLEEGRNIPNNTPKTVSMAYYREQIETSDHKTMFRIIDSPIVNCTSTASVLSKKIVRATLPNMFADFLVSKIHDVLKALLSGAW